MESTLSGWARVLLSDTSAAAVYCTIIRPPSRPLLGTSMAGSPPLNSGVNMRKMRRSAMSATSASAMASVSSHKAGPWPWKLPPDTARNSPASSWKMSGLSVAALMAALNRSRTNAT